MLALQFGVSEGGVLVGGTTNNLARLCAKLRSQGHDVTIITTPPPFPDASKPNTGTQYTARVLTLKLGRKHFAIRTGVGYFVKALIQAKHLHTQERFDIVHGHSAYPLFGVIVRAVSRLLGLPGVFSLHSPIGEGSNLETYLRYLQNPRLVERVLLANLRCTATSSRTKKSLDNVGITDSIVVYPFVSLSRFKPMKEEERREVRLKYNLGTGGFLLLYIGNLSGTKGLRDLLVALSRMKGSLDQNQVQIVIALDRPRADSERKLKPILERLVLKRYVVHLGIEPCIEKIMGASDLTVVPFRNTFGPADPPLSIIEAMATGCAVLTTRVGAFLR